MNSLGGASSEIAAWEENNSAAQASHSPAAADGFPGNLPSRLHQRALREMGWEWEELAWSAWSSARTRAPPHASWNLHRAWFPDQHSASSGPISSPTTETGFPESAAGPQGDRVGSNREAASELRFWFICILLSEL